MSSRLPSALSCFAAIVLLGCGAPAGSPAGGSGRPTAGGVAVVVTDELDGSQITLSQKQARWFVNDISGAGRPSMISKVPAAPIATFEYGGKKYLMHGNAVIHVQDDGTELLWTGPYLQALISAGSYIGESIDAVEKLPNLNGVKLEAPGAYPGGGPAPLAEDK